MLSTSAENPILHSIKANEFLLAIAPHTQRLQTYACQLAGPRGGDPKELLHETILLCHDRIYRRGFEGGSSEYVGYLFTQLRHQHQENYRQRHLQPVLMDVQNFSDLAEEAACDRTPLDMLAIAIKTFVHAHYSPKWETVFELHCEGLSYSEIHFATGVAKSTAQQLVQTIKAAIRQEFGAAFDDYQDDTL